MNAESYGCVRKDSLLVPEFVTSKPDNLPDTAHVASVYARMGVDAESNAPSTVNVRGVIAVRNLSQNDYSSDFTRVFSSQSCKLLGVALLNSHSEYFECFKKFVRPSGM